MEAVLRQVHFLIASALFLSGFNLGCCREPIKTAAERSVAPVLPAVQVTDVQTTAAPAPAPAKQESFDLTDYDRTIRLIKEQHVKGKDVKDADLFYSSVNGLVQALNDPYSEFMPPEEAKEFRTEMSGKVAGIGAIIGQKDSAFVIETPLEDSPAIKAGLKSGDYIIAVDSVAVHQMKLQNVIKLIRGPKGTKVKLTIARVGEKEPFDVEIIRDKVTIQSVKWQMDERHNIMVVTITRFQEDTAEQFAKAIDKTLNVKAKGMVVDLRNNPGGSLPVVILMACNWVVREPVVFTVPRDRPAEPDDCLLGGRLEDMPTAVLVNKGSASASEILAGALQDYGKARIIGETTWGKGCGQAVIPYPDGSLLKLTTFTWETPKRHTIDKVGVTPDEIVKPDSKDPKKDPQLERALRFLSEGK